MVIKKTKEKLLSIIVPCYNEETTIPLFVKEIEKEIKELPLNVELIFVNDGSTDSTEDVLESIYQKNIFTVTVINFSRNFGKESAMYAGLKYSKGDIVVVMDVDLQDPPNLLHEMVYAIEKEEYDVVATRRKNRKGEPLLRSFFAKQFYKIINKVSVVSIVDGARDYRMMTRQVVDALMCLGEYNRFSKGLYEWVGFSIKYIEYENVHRVAGETNWNFWSLFKYAIEGFVSFTTIPLRIASILGSIMSLVSFIYMMFVVVKTVLFGEAVQGYPSLMSVMLFGFGLQLIVIGILGEYLARVYTEVKKRPIYLVKSLLGRENDSL
ncbi:MAG: glycosyltransferase family 2 protein [bacterium]